MDSTYKTTRSISPFQNPIHSQKSCSSSKLSSSTPDKIDRLHSGFWRTTANKLPSQSNYSTKDWVSWVQILPYFSAAPPLPNSQHMSYTLNSLVVHIGKRSNKWQLFYDNLQVNCCAYAVIIENIVIAFVSNKWETALTSLITKTSIN